MKTVSALALVAMIAAAAPASAATVSYYNDQFQPDVGTMFANAGYTVNTITSGFTGATISGSQLVILSGMTGFDSAQLTALTGYVNAGGRLLLVSEAAGYASGSYIPPVNAVTSALGSSIFNQSTSLDGLSHVTTNIAANAFTAGVTNIRYAWSSSLTGGTTLVTGLQGQALVSYQQIGSGYVFVGADTNLLDQPLNNTLGNAQLLRNMAGVGATAAVPEPATWAMMIGGFGLVGASMRYRRRKVSVSFA